jgi:hypothetical protein
LLDLIDQAFDKKAWHGPNLRGSLRRVSVEEAAWRPASGRKCIAEIALHAAYWKYAVRRRLRGDRRNSFALKGSNWFVTPASLSDAEWRGYVKLLGDEHHALREAIASISRQRLHEISAGSRFTAAALIQGIAAHDLYHAGQIQTLKRLWGQSAREASGGSGA